MADAPDPDAQRPAAYRKAVDRLPVLTRVIFLLVRLDALSYDEIARRLSIDAQAVESCLVEALGMIRLMLDGAEPRRRNDPRIALAEADLHRRHRSYCEESLQALRIASSIPWAEDGDDDQTLMRAVVTAMPPRVHDTFILHGVERLSWTPAKTACVVVGVQAGFDAATAGCWRATSGLLAKAFPGDFTRFPWIAGRFTPYIPGARGRSAG